MLLDSLALSPTPPSPRTPLLPPVEIGRRVSALPLCLSRPERNYVSSNIAAAVQWGRRELNKDLLQSPPVAEMYMRMPYCSLRKAALHPCSSRATPQPFRLSMSPPSHLTSSTFDGYQNADAVRTHSRMQHALNSLVDDLPSESRAISNELLLSLHNSLPSSTINRCSGTGRDSTVLKSEF